MTLANEGLVLILGLFVFKHFIADFVLQTDRHIAGKYVYGRWAGIEHSLYHAILTIGVVIPFVSVSVAALIALIDLVVHYHLDYIKVRFGTQDPRKHSYWVWFGFDQMLHYLTYLVFVFKIIN